VHSHRSDDTLTLTVEGAFNFKSFEAFHRLIAEPAERYVVDLRKATSLDSSALALLLVLRQRSKHPVTLRVGDGQPREVLRMSNFATLFRVEP
jgi:anti-anti-sigma regulatory factor